MLTLREISDRMEIQALLVAYSDAIDRKQIDMLTEVFTPDAWIDYTAFGGIAGDRTTALAWLKRRMMPDRVHQHLVANADIRIDGDEASGRIMCLNPMQVINAAGVPQIGFYGLWYIDAYRRTEAGWRISSRSEEPSFAHNFPPGVRSAVD